MADLDTVLSLLIDIKKDQESIREQTIRNTVVLEEHMRRTEIGEARMNVQEEKLEAFMEKMVPIEDHAKLVNAIVKIALGLITAAAAIAAIIHALR